MSETGQREASARGKVIALGSDHAAFEQKERIKAWLEARGFTVEDYGTNSPERVDYPDIARPLAEDVAQGRVPRGVLMCGTGLGMAYTANRLPGIRAALCWSAEVAAMARDHNDANILVLPGRHPTLDGLEEILQAWLDTPFSGDERHQRRLDKMDADPADGEG